MKEKEKKIKIAKPVALLMLSIAFFILGIVFTSIVSLDSAVLAGCIIIFMSLFVMICSVADIASIKFASEIEKENASTKAAEVEREEQCIALLNKYKRLQTEGIISEEEFLAKKESMLKQMRK